MNGQMDKEGEWSRSIVSSTAVENPKISAKQNLLNLISINSTKISPLRVAAVEDDHSIGVNGSLSKGLFKCLAKRFNASANSAQAELNVASSNRITTDETASLCLGHLCSLSYKVFDHRGSGSVLWYRKHK